MANQKGATNQDDNDFPWHLGVYDSHCHPTDTESSIHRIPEMKTRVLTIMATRAQDQALVANFADKLAFARESFQTGEMTGTVVPAFGWHPWFSHQIYDDSSSIPGKTKEPSKEVHYQRVLSPSPIDKDFLESLPRPLPLSALIKDLRDHLEQFPLSLVGEVGMDRSFRIPETKLLPDDFNEDPSITPGSRQGRPLSPHRVVIAHQRKILISQLNLAGEMQRAVSVHGVAAHGAVHDALQETWRGYERQNLSNRAKKRQACANAQSEVEVEEPRMEASFGRGRPLPYPPRICLHSYSGRPENLKQYLHPSVPVKLFFSFSSLVSFSGPRKKVIDVMEIVPEDRILVESDLHAAGEDMDNLMEDITRKVCEIRGWTLEHGVEKLAANWKSFVLGDELG